MGTQRLKKGPMGTRVPKWGPIWEQWERSEEAEPDLGSTEVEVTAEEPTDTLELTGEIAGFLRSCGASEGGRGEESPLSSSRKLVAWDRCFFLGISRTTLGNCWKFNSFDLFNINYQWVLFSIYSNDKVVTVANVTIYRDIEIPEWDIYDNYEIETRFGSCPRGIFDQTYEENL